MAAPHPKADVARSLSPRPLIGFDDPPNDRVADDVGAREPADVDPLQPLEPRDRVGEARGRGDRQVDLLGVAADHHAAVHAEAGQEHRSEEHTSALQSLMRISYAVFCLKKNNRDSTDKYTSHD